MNKVSKFSMVLMLLMSSLIWIGCQSADSPTENAKAASQLNKTADGIEFCGTPKTVTLWAGQTIDAGEVTIYNDAVNLYVTVHSDSGYQTVDEQIKMWVGGDLLDLPLSGGGAPINGQFPYKITTDGGTTYTFTILLDDLSLINDCGDLLYVVVHADVLADDGIGGTLEQTAYSGDMVGNTGARWWFYTDYDIQCCDGTPPVLDQCETAFAKGTHVFTTGRKSNPDGLPSLDLTKNRWGWAININGEVNNTYPIYAGAGLNNTDKGTLVGELSVVRSGNDVTVTYSLDPSYEMQELHIYVGDSEPTTIAPGQYGNTVYFDPMESGYSQTFTVGSDDVWIIAHAVVCW